MKQFSHPEKVWLGFIFNFEISLDIVILGGYSISQEHETTSYNLFLQFYLYGTLTKLLLSF